MLSFGNRVRKAKQSTIRSVQSNVVIVRNLLAVGRWLKWIVPHPPGDASVFVRTKYLPFVSETLTESVFQILTELRCRSTFSAMKCNW
jgi:hypothetical protein